MLDNQPVKIPTPKPGDFIWVGRFRNRAAIVTKVFVDDKGAVKYEFEPVPKGRKKSKVRNLLPYRPMSQEDTAKYKRIYDDETAEIRAKKKAAEVLTVKVLARAESEGRRGPHVT